jgi:predicted ATP-grasp superfamily ATP-dependent carboligase
MASVRALILDSRDARASLAAARGLKRGGWTVGVAAPSPTLASSSRCVSRLHVVPLPEDGADGFVAALGAAVAEGGYEVVFASSDADMLALATVRSRLDVVVPYPSVEVLRRAMDKLELSSAARAVGLSAPAAATSASEAAALLDDGAESVIVKERLHGGTGAGGRPTHVNPLVSRDPGEVSTRVEEVLAAGALPLVQPVVQGRLMAFTSIVDGEGRMLARVQQEAERTWPDGMGCSVRARTVPVSDELSDRVVALLRSLGWTGLSELQFLVPFGGEPQLIDFNGRFYGSLALALGAGVNLPDIWARLVTGRPVDSRVDARPGVKYQWLEGDLRAAREASGSLVDCLKYAASARHSVSSLRDPRPLMRAVRSVLRERRSGS